MRTSWQLELQEKLTTVFYDGRVVPRHTSDEHYYEDVADGQVYPSVTTKTSVLGKHYLKQWAVNKTIDVLTMKAGDIININEPFELIEMIESSKYAHVSSLEQAATWGNQAHDLVEKYMLEWIKRGVRPDNIIDLAPNDISNEGKCGALSAMKFFDEHTLFPIASEQKIISKKYEYAGTLDSLWLVGDGTYKGREGLPDCKHDWYEKNKKTVHCIQCGREEKLAIMLGDWKTSSAIFGKGQMAKWDYAAQVSAYSKALTEMTGIRPKYHWVIRLDKQKPHYEIGSLSDLTGSFNLFKKLAEVNDYVRSDIEPLKNLKVKKRIVL